MMKELRQKSYRALMDSSEKERLALLLGIDIGFIIGAVLTILWTWL